MQNCYKNILIIVFIICGVKISAQDNIQSIKANKNKVAIKKILVLIDSSCSITFDSIVHSQSFKKLPDNQKVTSPGVCKWVKFAIKSEKSRLFYLVMNKFYREVLLYQQEAKGEFSMKKSYFYSQEKDKIIPNPSHIFEVYLDTVPKVFYARIVADIPNFGLGGDFLSHNRVIKTIQEERREWYFLLFSTILVVIINLMLYLVYNESKYIFLALTFVFLFVFQCVNLGILNPIFEYIKFGFQYYTIPYSFSAITLLLFVQQYFNTSPYNRYIKTIALILIGLRLVVLTVGSIINPLLWGDSLVEAIMLFPGLLLGFFMVWKKQKGSVLFILLYSVIYLGYLNHKFDFLDVQEEFFTSRSLFFNPLSNVFLLILLVYIAYDLYSLNKQKLLLYEQTLDQQNKLIRNSEELNLLRIEYQNSLESYKINAVQGNEDIARKFEEINFLNEELKKDIVQLKDNLIWVKKTNLLKPNASYEEFKEVFPNDNAVLGLISQIKWKEKFKCRKCGYNRYYEGTEPFSRQCRSCNYRESASAKTIFENTRADRVKLLFALYYFHQFPSYPLKQFSDDIEMRYATLLDFNKKIKDKLTEHKDGIKSWTDLILP
ncbi:MAG: transposase [Bacteroidota bacterium]|nr:transposase [Bacteroidota bacterium]